MMIDNPKLRAVQTLQEKGFPHIARMCEIFDKPTEIDKALDLTNNAHNWFHLRSMPTKSAENLARYWLMEYDRNRDVEPGEEADIEAQVPVPVPTESEKILLVICPVAAQSQIQRILGLMKCDVEVVA